MNREIRCEPFQYIFIFGGFAVRSDSVADFRAVVKKNLLHDIAFSWEGFEHKRTIFGNGGFRIKFSAVYCDVSTFFKIEADRPIRDFSN